MHVLPVLEERPAEHAFLDGSELAKDAVAASVLNNRARFQPVYIRMLEGEVHCRSCAGEEQPRSPERRAESEAPFRDGEPGRNRPNLYKPDGVVETFSCGGRSRQWCRR